MTSKTSIGAQQAKQELNKVQARADRAFARFMADEVQSPAYAQHMARKLEEAQATYDLANYDSGRG